MVTAFTEGQWCLSLGVWQRFYTNLEPGQLERASLKRPQRRVRGSILFKWPQGRFVIGHDLWHIHVWRLYPWIHGNWLKHGVTMFLVEGDLAFCCTGLLILFVLFPDGVCLCLFLPWRDLDSFIIFKLVLVFFSSCILFHNKSLSTSLFDLCFVRNKLLLIK